MNTHNISALIKLTEQYSFNSHNIHKLISSEYFETKATDKKKSIAQKSYKKNDDFFIPSEDDSLFWCWFIFKNGFSEYEMLREKNFIIEKEYKIKFIEKIRENKKILKHMKVKVSEMEGHLANDPKLNINYLEPMLILDKFNFVFMNNKIWYEKIIIPQNQRCIIKFFEKQNKYGLFLVEQKLFDYTSKLLKVDSVIKPIKGISNYKAQQIKDMCKKLNIDIMKTPTKSKTKKELYQLVIEKIL